MSSFGAMQKLLALTALVVACATAPITSSQQARPPPRSDAFACHPLRGVITQTGGRLRRVPAIVATTLNAVAR